MNKNESLKIKQNINLGIFQKKEKFLDILRSTTEINNTRRKSYMENNESNLTTKKIIGEKVDIVWVNNKDDLSIDYSNSTNIQNSAIEKENLDQSSKKCSTSREIFKNISIEENSSKRSVNFEKFDEKDITLLSSARSVEEPIISTENSNVFSAFCSVSYKNQKKHNSDKTYIKINLKTKINFFGIYDGHKSSEVSELLEYKLHNNILDNPNFRENPIRSIVEGFKKTEDEAIEMQKSNEISLTAGSCAITCITIDDIIYIANLGDSRAIISLDNFSRINQINFEHNTHAKLEKKRLMKKNISFLKSRTSKVGEYKQIIALNHMYKTRTIGDFTKKYPTRAHEDQLISPIPDVISFKANKKMDFILLGTDSLFKKNSNLEVIEMVLESTKNSLIQKYSLSKCLEEITEFIKDTCMKKRKMGNLTFTILFFENFKMKYENGDLRYFCGSLENLRKNKIDHNSMYTENILEKHFLIEDKSIYQQKRSFFSCLKSFCKKN